MNRFTLICLKILRALLIFICIICSASTFGLLGTLETSIEPLSFYAQPIFWCAAGAVVSFIMAKVSHSIIKVWG